MDVLSEVLKSVKLSGAVFFNGEFSAPWCFSSSPSAAKNQFLSGTGHLIIFHFLTEGRAYVRLPSGKKEELAAGDIVILPHGDTHFLGNGAPEKPVDSFRAFAKDVAKGLKVVRFGGGGEITKFVCGYLSCEPRLSEVFLAGLPKVLVVHVAKEASGQWLESSIRFSVDAANGSDAGSGLMLAKLSELLFVETLRRYISTLPPDKTGWLAGARDPVIGKALALLHKEPAYPWTISALARRVGLSRTRLAERFRHFLGEPPMAYLMQWRLKPGAEILQSTEDSVAQVAAAVGYGSEAAFNRAFKRGFACPPAQFRRQRNGLPANGKDDGLGRLQAGVLGAAGMRVPRAGVRIAAGRAHVRFSAIGGPPAIRVFLGLAHFHAAAADFGSGAMAVATSCGDATKQRRRVGEKGKRAG